MTRKKRIWDQGDVYEQVYEYDVKLGKVMLGENTKKRKKRGVKKTGKKKPRTKFEISRGDLTSLGYHLSKPARVRHQALGKAVKKYGYTETMRKLTFLKGPAKLTKTQKRRVAADMRWLKEKYGDKRR